MAHYSLIFLVIGLFSHAVTARPQGIDHQALNSMVLGMMAQPPAPSCSSPPAAMDPTSAVRYMMDAMNEGKSAPIAPPIILVSPPMMPPPMIPPPMMMPPVIMSPYMMGPPMGPPPPTTEAPKPETTPEPLVAPTAAPTAAPEPVTDSPGPQPPVTEEPKPIMVSGPLPPEVVEETTTPRSSEPTEYTTAAP